MNKDCGFQLSQLQVDGILAKNNLLMQLQADLIGIPVGKGGKDMSHTIRIYPRTFQPHPKATTLCSVLRL